MVGSERANDLKDGASLTFAQVARDTRTNYKDKRFHPHIYRETARYNHFGINYERYLGWTTADGIGTKPELAERLANMSDVDTSDVDPQTEAPEVFESLLFDLYAMIESDEARRGRFLLGIDQVFNFNVADPRVTSALARGAKKACDAGGFALLTGETAELGYRVSGWGPVRVDMNATGVSVINPAKLVTGENLAPGQPIVALQETSIRSNGLSKARALMEAIWLNEVGLKSKDDFIASRFKTFLREEEVLNDSLAYLIDHGSFSRFITELMGHNFPEQVLVPWHRGHSDITKELLRPSTFYGLLVQAALGGVDGEKIVDITAMAHISGGGIPLKARLMLEDKGLGAHIDAVFPDPKGVAMLLETAERVLPADVLARLINDRGACEQWNRGLGFLNVCATDADADRLIELAPIYNLNAASAGRVLDERKIEFRGHTWTY